MRWTLLVLGVCCGCGARPSTDRDLGPGASIDFAGPGSDLAATVNDLSTSDLEPHLDLTLVPDQPDIAADDLAQADLSSVANDLEVADLEPNPDLTAIAAPDLEPASDLAQPDLAPGSPCASDGDCASHLCKPALAGTKVCVTPCSAEVDCATVANSYCAPTTVGATSGVCVPRSPMHCAACAIDSDCGGLADRCIQAPGDGAPACHVDCSLGGLGACPADYTCAAVPDGATTRRLCVPALGACLDSLGGFCDRVTTPQNCSRLDAAGVCTGQRACLPSGRYDKCDAATPQLKQCGMTDPPGCIEQADPNAATTAQNCGACGNACAGAGTVGADVACVDPKKKSCSFTCEGERYDVNNNPADGCEQLHETVGHRVAAATSLGSQDCFDSTVRTFSAHLDSDSRVHANPAVTAFDATVGSAPDVYSVVGSGGSCFNNYSVTLTTSGGGAVACYRVTLKTDLTTNSVTTTGNGTVNMNDQTFGLYSDGATLFFTVDKTCSLPVQESIQYSVTFHL
jgi:hypothetical protein